MASTSELNDLQAVTGVLTRVPSVEVDDPTRAVPGVPARPPGRGSVGPHRQRVAGRRRRARRADAAGAAGRRPGAAPRRRAQDRAVSGRAAAAGLACVLALAAAAPTRPNRRSGRRRSCAVRPGPTGARSPPRSPARPTPAAPTPRPAWRRWWRRCRGGSRRSPAAAITARRSCSCTARCRARWPRACARTAIASPPTWRGSTPSSPRSTSTRSTAGGSGAATTCRAPGAWPSAPPRAAR